MFEIKSYAEGQMLDRKTAQTLTKPEAIANLSARLSAERAINRHLRQKVSNQRRQLRQLQALYNAYLIGAKSGAALHEVAQGIPESLRQAKARYDREVSAAAASIVPLSDSSNYTGASSELPTPTSGLMEQGRKMEASA